MKYIKSYEKLQSVFQEPFFLSSSGNILYVSDEFAKKILPKYKRSKYNQSYITRELENQKDFFNNTVNEKGYLKARRISLDMTVRYDIYSMSLFLSRNLNGKTTKSGTYHSYLSGRSGDSEMHGKNMIRATRECNMNFMIKFYPIIEHIKDFYKIFKTGELGFFEIIRNALDKNIMLAQYGVPKELNKETKYKDMEAYVKGSIKYNI